MGRQTNTARARSSLDLVETSRLKPCGCRPGCSELHERVEAFCRRDLYEIKLVVLFLDAIYLSVRPITSTESS
jgi:hypothetical protein